MSLLRLLKADVRRLVADARTRDLLRLLAIDPGFRTVAIYRLQQCARARSLALIFSNLNVVLHGCDIKVGAQFGQGLVVRHPMGVVAGYGVVVGANATISHGATLGGKHIGSRSQNAYPTIGDNVELGSYCQILGAVEVGDRVTVGALSIVTRSVESDVTVVGVNMLRRNAVVR